MLEDEIYLGHTISLRYTTPSYKNKKKIECLGSEWLRFEKTHEPLITSEIWELVREVRKHKWRTPTTTSSVAHLFKRLYEDNVLGRIPDEQYRILSAE